MAITPRRQRWLHRYAVLWAGAVFGLVALGGVVTTKEAGLAVPDWPTTFGHNMFLVPLDEWLGPENVFWEHTHRLAGSAVGLLTIGLAVLLWPRRPARPWLRPLGLALLALVIVQGVMGGLRVTEVSRSLAMLHGITAQLLVAAAVTTAVALRPPTDRPEPVATPGARALALALLAGMIVQLVLGAWIRHHDAATAIPDFPTAYGALVPPTSGSALAAAAQAAGLETKPTLMAVWIHFAHRAGAVLVAGLGIAAASVAARPQPRAAAAVALTLALQLVLGPLVVLTDAGQAWATLHQVGGAAAIGAAAWLAARLHCPAVALGGAARTDASGHAAPAAPSYNQFIV